MRVLKVREGETMEDTMKREQAEAIATLMKANRAFDRIFGIQEEEGENE
jgi:phospholipase C